MWSISSCNAMRMLVHLPSSSSLTNPNPLPKWWRRSPIGLTALSGPHRSHPLPHPPRPAPSNSLRVLCAPPLPSLPNLLRLPSSKILHRRRELKIRQSKITVTSFPPPTTSLARLTCWPRFASFCKMTMNLCWLMCLTRVLILWWFDLVQLSKKVVDMSELRSRACQGIPDAAGIRSTVWKVRSLSHSIFFFF